MNEKRITDSELEAQREKERAAKATANAAAGERIWQVLKTLAGWIAGFSMILALGYDLFLKVIGRR